MAYIFDMDGTMIDNMMVHHRAWQKTLREAGLEMTLDEVKANIHGINEEILYRLFGERYTVEERKRLAEKKESDYREIYLPELKLLPGLQHYLDYLRSNGDRLAIASAAPRKNVDFVVDELGIRHYFHAILQAEDVKNGKPHPEIYLKTSELLGVEPGDCMVYEDSPTGAKAASAAGCRITVLTTTHEENEFNGISGIIKFVEDFREVIP